MVNKMLSTALQDKAAAYNRIVRPSIRAPFKYKRERYKGVSGKNTRRAEPHVPLSSLGSHLNQTRAKLLNRRRAWT